MRQRTLLGHWLCVPRSCFPSYLLLEILLGQVAPGVSTCNLSRCLLKLMGGRVNLGCVHKRIYGECRGGRVGWCLLEKVITVHINQIEE